MIISPTCEETSTEKVTCSSVTQPTGGEAGRTSRRVLSTAGRANDCGVEGHRSAWLEDCTVAPAGSASCCQPSILTPGPEGVRGIAKALDRLHRGELCWSSNGHGVGVAFSSLPYLECSSWLRTVGRKKRDLRREKSHMAVTSEAKEGNTPEERGQEEQNLPVCLPRDQEPGKSLWGMLCGHVLTGKAVDWV